ncbi:hypothetical protein [Roseovarius aquimarinus]|uniref:SMODS and SLOG-associating 2TM effector domain-containing protein n=1 Tax=Roseovarius aquimarinus TaxID=1229156 RepID=A0ABW7I6H7_9RHOB
MAYSDDLTTPHVPIHAIRPGLRLKPLQSHGTKLTDEEIDHVIARTLAEDRKYAARDSLPPIASQEELSGHAGRQARRAAREREAAEARLGETRARYGAEPQTAPQPVEDLRAAARFRLPALPTVPAIPRRARQALAALGVLAVIWFRPFEVFLALCIALTLCLAGVLALSSDTVSNALVRVYRWRHARSPARAERMRRRLDALAMRIDNVLDALPERWTTGLYMADFSREALGVDHDRDAADPFDRLRDEAARG